MLKPVQIPSSHLNFNNSTKSSLIINKSGLNLSANINNSKIPSYYNYNNNDKNNKQVIRYASLPNKDHLQNEINQYSDKKNNSSEANRNFNSVILKSGSTPHYNSSPNIFSNKPHNSVVKFNTKSTISNNVSPILNPHINMERFKNPNVNNGKLVKSQLKLGSYTSEKK